MIVTIAEHFTSDPSDRERSPTIIWKPGFSFLSEKAPRIQITVISTVLSRYSNLRQSFSGVSQSCGLLNNASNRCFLHFTYIITSKTEVSYFLAYNMLLESIIATFVTS